MSIWERENEEENDENEADEDEEFRSQTDRMVFLIDARADMLETNSKGETHLQNCLAVALEAIKTKIISQDASTIGVIFFGCRSNDEGEAPGVYTLFPISTPSAKNIRLLQAMIEDIGEFERLVGSQSPSNPLCPLKQALWRCKLAFGTKDLKKTDFKRVWIFTNDDYPNAPFPEEQNKVVQIAKDCADGGIEISLWHCDRSAHRAFSPALFYHRLLKASILKTADGDEDEDELDEEENLQSRMMGGGFDGFDSSVASVRRKQFRKRRMGQLLFSFTDRPLLSPSGDAAEADGADREPLMCVRLYKTVQILKKPLHTWISMRSNEPVATVTRYLDASSGAIVPPEQIETYVDVQGRAVPLGADDVAAIKRRDPWTGYRPVAIDKKDPLKTRVPGIRLLCCFPRKQLPLQLTLSTPYFLFPGESAVKGSAALFESFLRELLRHDLVALVRFTRNLSAGKPTPAVLLPQAEVVVDGVQVTPPGLQCVPLPCVEDLRFNPQPDNVALLDDPLVQSPSGGDGEVLRAVKAYASAMALDAGEEGFSHATDIDNPSLQLFYALLQAVALNEEQLAWKPETHDTLRPRPELLERAQPALSSLQALLQLFGDDAEADAVEAKGRKRAAPAAPKEKAAPKGRATSRKAKKADDDDDDEDEAPAPKRSRAAAAKTTTTATSRRRVKKEHDDDDDDEDFF